MSGKGERNLIKLQLYHIHTLSLSTMTESGLTQTLLTLPPKPDGMLGEMRYDFWQYRVRCQRHAAAATATAATASAATRAAIADVEQLGPCPAACLLKMHASPAYHPP